MSKQHHWLAWLGLALAGCSTGPAPPPSTLGPASPEAGSGFDASVAGSIQGTVRWDGPIPTVGPYQVPAVDPAVGPPHGALVRPNPNAPAIDPASRGIRDAVVSLRGIAPERCRPWDHPPVRIVHDDFDLRIEQAPGRGRIGFVHRGDRVEMVSHQSALHALHAEGAAFFTLSFPLPDQPQTRRFDQAGIVELRSAATYWWQRAYLFVDDHPYQVSTRPDGGFELRDVPPGDYELVCWLPDWREAKRDLDPETGIVLRLFYREPLIRSQRVLVQAHEPTEAGFVLSARDLQP